MTLVLNVTPEDLHELITVLYVLPDGSTFLW